MNKRKENRLVFLQVVFVILFIILLVRLSNLMIKNGDYYKDISDNRKIQEVDEIASRGNILDRNGKVLATTVPSFAVRLYKDQLSKLDEGERRKVLENLVSVLEEDGVSYNEDFQVRLNSLEYQSPDDYFEEEETPTEKLANIIIDNNLIGDVISLVYEKDDFKYEVMKTTLLALKKRGIDIPCEVDQADGNLKISFKKNAGKKLQAIGYSMDMDPMEVVLDAVGKDKSVIMNILENQYARKLIYDYLESKSLEENVVLEKAGLVSDEKLLEKKSKLHRAYENITIDSKASDDFYEIVAASSLNELLTSASLDDNGEYIIPADILIEQLQNKGEYVNVQTEVVTESKDNTNTYSVNLSFINPQDGDPAEELIKMAKKDKLLKPLILSDDVKYLAQNANTANNIYPSIDISEDDPDDWAYTYMNEKKDFFTYYGQKDKHNKTKDVVKALENTEEAEKILKYIKIIAGVEAVDDYTACGLLSIENKLSNQGSFGFRPINLVYNLDESTVMKIEESIDSTKGVSIEVVPIRYYPNRSLASHVLGYMGPIATDEEINKFVKEKDYPRDEIIGKTGIEESYQDNLRGKNGKSIVAVDSAGNRKETLSHEESEPGDDLYLSLDYDLQKTAEDSLREMLSALQEGRAYESEYGTFPPYKSSGFAQSGAVVVSKVKTGEVLAMASLPDYDPNLFATGISESDRQSLQVPEDAGALYPRPLLNIASQTAVMPGSVFKLVTSLAALEKGLNPQAVNVDHGFVEVGNQRFNNLRWTEEGTTWGEETLYDAIGHSSNYYFYTLALGENSVDGDTLGVKVELEDIRSAAIELGLDRTTGIEINIPMEAKGNIPSKDKKLEVTKAMMQSYLKENIRRYIKEDAKKTKDQVDKDIEDLVKMTENASNISRDDLIDFLEERDYSADEILEGDRAGLADTIKYTYFNQASRDITDMLNIVIGQGQNSYTPLQLNRMVSAIANGGYVNKLTLIDKVTNHDTGETIFENETKNEKMDTDPKYLEDIRYGTLMVTQSNKTLADLPINLGIKTGTGEVEGENEDGSKYDSYSWMVGYFPYEEPEIAVSIVMTQGLLGYNCTPIMRDICLKYLDQSGKGQAIEKNETDDSILEGNLND